MFANRVVLLSAALGSLVVGCGHDDRANAAPRAAASPASAAHPARHVEPKTAAKKAPTSSVVRHAAAKPTAKSATGALVLKVPEAHLPPAGQCRVWKEGTSVFQQPQARSCDGIVATAPAGSMILDRPSKDTKIVRVRYIDAHRGGHVVRVRVFEAASGKYLRDEKI